MKLPLPQDGEQINQFDYEIYVASSFDEVVDYKKTDAHSVNIDEFANIVYRSACTLLQARGGAGKTYTAGRVCDRLRKRGIWTVILPAPTISDANMLATSSPERWAEAAGDTPDYDTDAGAGLIVVDGLNELGRLGGERILGAIGPVTAINPHVSFLITDRLTRRRNVSPFWKHATLSAVPRDVIRRIADSEPTEGLSIPFYLARHKSGHTTNQILTESVKRYADGEELTQLAAAAYMSYEKCQRRTLDQHIVNATLGRNFWENLLDANAIVAVKTADSTDHQARDFHFEHHLLHDFLAARHLAKNTQLWNAKGFDIVTLKASSFDALTLALPQLSSDVAVEDLVQRVYEWNFYAAAYMLGQDREGDHRIGDGLQLALLGSLAEKQFDDVVPTVVRVKDALRVQHTPLAAALLTAVNRNEVVRELQGYMPPARQPGWFAEWRCRYLQAPRNRPSWCHTSVHRHLRSTPSPTRG
jgi:hypothetical protein